MSAAIVAGFCMKNRYRTMEFAERVRDDCERKRGVRLYIYLCQNCLCYHLTRQGRHEGRAR